MAKGGALRVTPDTLPFVMQAWDTYSQANSVTVQRPMELQDANLEQWRAAGRIVPGSEKRNAQGAWDVQIYDRGVYGTPQVRQSATFMSGGSKLLSLEDSGALSQLSPAWAKQINEWRGRDTGSMPYQQAYALAQYRQLLSKGETPTLQPGALGVTRQRGGPATVNQIVEPTAAQWRNVQAGLTAGFTTQELLQATDKEFGGNALQIGGARILSPCAMLSFTGTDSSGEAAPGALIDAWQKIVQDRMSGAQNPSPGLAGRYATAEDELTGGPAFRKAQLGTHIRTALHGTVAGSEALRLNEAYVNQEDLPKLLGIQREQIPAMVKDIEARAQRYRELEDQATGGDATARGQLADIADIDQLQEQRGGFARQSGLYGGAGG